MRQKQEVKSYFRSQRTRQLWLLCLLCFQLNVTVPDCLVEIWLKRSLTFHTNEIQNDPNLGDLVALTMTKTCQITGLTSCLISSQVFDDHTWMIHCKENGCVSVRYRPSIGRTLQKITTIKRWEFWLDVSYLNRWQTLDYSCCWPFKKGIKGCKNNLK